MLNIKDAWEVLIGNKKAVNNNTPILKWVSVKEPIKPWQVY